VAFCGADAKLPARPLPMNFLFTGSGDLSEIKDLLSRPDIAGVQVVYNWKDLEPEKGRYDFNRIEEDLRVLAGLKKKLFVQVQDRFFLPEARNVPAYLLNDAVYGGGLVRQKDNPGEGLPEGAGWVAQQWNPAVRRRFQALLRALAKSFDGRIYGLNLPESSVEIDLKRDRTGFTCDKYFNAELENLKAAKAAFRKSYVVQYVNFWPCEWENDRGYMGRVFKYAAASGVGLGGPDIVPYRKGQMKNSYPFFHDYKGRLALVAMAVQEATLTYTDPETKQPFTRERLEDFGRNYLGADIIFWSLSSPWLKAAAANVGDADS